MDTFHAISVNFHTRKCTWISPEILSARIHQRSSKQGIHKNSKRPNKDGATHTSEVVSSTVTRKCVNDFSQSDLRGWNTLLCPDNCAEWIEWETWHTLCIDYKIFSWISYCVFYFISITFMLKYVLIDALIHPHSFTVKMYRVFTLRYTRSYTRCVKVSEFHHRLLQLLYRMYIKSMS